jgi:hypothetical protein
VRGHARRGDQPRAAAAHPRHQEGLLKHVPVTLEHVLVSRSLLLLALAGCHGGAPVHGLATDGALGVPASASFVGNVLFAAVTVDGVGGDRLLVDTGSPFTLLDPVAFPTVAGGDGAHAGKLTVGGVTVEDVPAIGLGFGGGNGPMVAGILGANVLCQFSTALDYRGGAVRLGAAADPDGVDEPGQATSFALEGGGSVAGNDGRIDFPATRIAITANIEGVDHPLVVDTGASDVVLRQALFTQITSDGRKRLDDLPITTVSGTTNASAARLRALTVAGAQLSGIAALTVGDQLLDTITSEVGHPVDGLLGGTFLREFFVTVDYPARVIHLQRYASRDHIVDEYVRVGVRLTTAPSGYVIAQVYAGSDAAQKGLSLGDELRAVDGTALAALDAEHADRLLDAPAGSTHALSVGYAANVALRDSTVQVLAQDLIALQ